MWLISLSSSNYSYSIPALKERCNIEALEQIAEVVDTNQEWEIRDIIGKGDADGAVHYLVK